MGNYLTPGIYRQELFPAPADRFRTGTPVFLGVAAAEPLNKALPIERWPQFGERFKDASPGGCLADAVYGFFANEGRRCYVLCVNAQSAPWPAAIERALAALEPLDDCDLLCAPGLFDPGGPGQDELLLAQQALLADCDARGDRFAILDGLPDPRQGIAAYTCLLLKQRHALSGLNGALYAPWAAIAAPGAAGQVRYVPPSGHIAGVYARVDTQRGVHKAPANETLTGVLDLEVNLKDTEQGPLNHAGINCLRAFPGRGIRVWGVRSLAGEQHPEWKYVSVRRLFLTVGRWIERNLTGAAFEPAGPRLWARIERELTAYFTDLFQRGALGGSTPREAFYIRCDATTTPPDARERGEVITEIGLAPGPPNEYVVVRIIHSTSGLTISGPARPG